MRGIFSLEVCESVDEPRASTIATPTGGCAPLGSDTASSGDAVRGIPYASSGVPTIVVRGVVLSSSWWKLASVLALETELNRGCSDMGRNLGSSNSGRAFCVGWRVSSV